MPVSPTEIIFSPEQQLALLGHAVLEPKVFQTALAMGVSPAWFYNANHQSIWQALQTFEEQHRGRHPTVPELRATSAFKNDDPIILQARAKALDGALAGAGEMSFDSIVLELREWSKGQIFVRHMEEASEMYNRKDVSKAYALAARMNQEIDRVDQHGLQARCLEAPDRVDIERAERLEQKNKTLSYGVSYLDDATGGIGVNELVLIGAKTGVGKTQLVTRIASFNARRKKRVALFALEAEPNEIERRIKFSVLAAEYRRKFPRSEVNLNYRDWRRGAFDEELAPFEGPVNAMMRERYSTLRTIYKGYGAYTVSDLERDIVRLAPTTDLIIVDHLHYIDSSEGTKDEFESQKHVLKVLRDLALSLSKPIILVAHLRKTQGGRKNSPLVPDLEDFHGSSDIIKIATTAILLSPCYENWALFTAGIPEYFIDQTVAPPRPARLWATYMRVGKFRIEGAITRYTGIAFFDDATGNYREQYGVGRLTSGDCSWTPEEHQPYWADHGMLKLAEH